MGALYGSLWLVPREHIEGLLPQGMTPVTFNGKAILATGWAVYRPGGVLNYHECLCGIAVRSPQGIGLSITQIWVDSAASMAGGRELWGIPKQLARFTDRGGGDFRQDAQDEAGLIASFSFTRALPLPGTWPIPLRTIQRLGDSLKATRLQASGRLSFGKATWDFTETGPFSFLHGLKPLVNMRLEPMTVHFGLSSGKTLEGRLLNR